jgi:putative MFS transporter
MALIARASLMGASSATVLMVPELYTTELRSTGHGTANAMTKLGGFIAPFLVEASGMGVVGIFVWYGSMNALVASSCYFFPFETAGRDLDAAKVPLSKEDIHKAFAAVKQHEGGTKEQSAV